MAVLWLKLALASTFVTKVRKSGDMELMSELNWDTVLGLLIMAEGVVCIRINLSLAYETVLH